MIQTSGLTKRYGSFTAVDGIGIDIPPGEIYGFLGPNGAGAGGVAGRGGDRAEPPSAGRESRPFGRAGVIAC